MFSATNLRAEYSWHVLRTIRSPSVKPLTFRQYCMTVAAIKGL